MRAEHAVRKQGKGMERLIYDGMSVYRRGNGTSLAQVCGRIAALQNLYPTLEVRIPNKPRISPTIHTLEAAEVRRKKNLLGHLKLSTVIKEVFANVPSLSESMVVVMDQVDTSTDPNSMAKFIEISPRDEDFERLQNERGNVLSVLNNLALSSSLEWPVKPCNMTVAYVPLEIQDSVVNPILKTVDEMLPIEVTLHSATY